MSVFLAAPLAQNAKNLASAVKASVAEDDRYALPNDMGWLISFKGTTIELSNHIGITGQEKGVSSPVGSTMIVSIGTYFGRGSADMWEWLKTRFESAA